MGTRSEVESNPMTIEEFSQELKGLLTQKEVARILNVTKKTVIFWNRVGVRGRTLPKIRIGGRVFYRPEDVMNFKQLITGGK